MITGAVRGRFPQTPGSIEAGQHKLTPGTGLVARRLEVADIAGLLWLSWCVLSAAGFEIIGLALFTSNAHGPRHVPGCLALSLEMRPFHSYKQNNVLHRAVCFILHVVCIYGCPLVSITIDGESWTWKIFTCSMSTKEGGLGRMWWNRGSPSRSDRVRRSAVILMV